MKKIIFFITALLLYSCTKEKAQSETLRTDTISVNPNLRADSLNTAPRISEEQVYKDLNEELLLLLKNKDFEQFATYLHPEKGITFSMYAYIQPKKDKHFTREEFLKYVLTNIKFTWGEKDGTGDLLQISIKDYLNSVVFRKDFTKSDFAFNSFLKSGNSLNNLKEIYPTNNFTENYIPGTEEYSEMDWNTLRFVFEEYKGKPYLIAIVNDEWTV